MVKARRFASGKFYRVVWIDIISHAGWEEKPKEPPAECVSYGWLSAKPKGAVILSATRGKNTDGSVEYNQHITIPLGVINIVEEIQ